MARKCPGLWPWPCAKCPEYLKKHCKVIAKTRQEYLSDVFTTSEIRALKAIAKERMMELTPEQIEELDHSMDNEGEL
jgi:hypothetical protein